MKKTKKLFLFALAVTLFAVVFCFSASALEETGKCGPNVTWNFNSETGELVISGEGYMYDYEDGKSPFFDTDIESVIVEYGVTRIGRASFQSCLDVDKIVIPDSVYSIGIGAFYGCAIKEIRLSKNIENIEDFTFAYCRNLKNIMWPDNLLNIGNAAFSGIGAEHITIPDSVISIGGFAFMSSLNLKSITIPKDVNFIGADAFSGCHKLTDIYYLGLRKDWDSIKGVENSFQNSENVKLHFNYNECLHKNVIIKDNVEPTCEKEGYSGNIYCVDCEIKLQEGDFIIMIEHKYIDDRCEYCGETRNGNCVCICHKNGVFLLFWKLLRFVCKSFNINKICICDDLHY